MKRKLLISLFISSLITLGMNSNPFEVSHDIGNIKAAKKVAISKEKAGNVLESACFIKNKKTREEIIEAAQMAAEKYDLQFEMIIAVMSVESGCRNSARSNKGALGLMQLMPSTAKWLGIEKPHLITNNINGGAKYLAFLVKEFDGDYRLAIAAYNSGPYTVKKYGKIPPYQETRQYVKGVINKYNKFIAKA
ncbi:MAG: lytic transglycosylase domain-containing protein [Proteobacteria bacterium]|nr:lytic transglycosylase domain-containing protein [Pseudomonadota bacterium]